MPGAVSRDTPRDYFAAVGDEIAEYFGVLIVHILYTIHTKPAHLFMPETGKSFSHAFSSYLVDLIGKNINITSKFEVVYLREP
jgi:hypothetical protein